jgi:hypothetical protein
MKGLRGLRRGLSDKRQAANQERTAADLKDDVASADLVRNTSLDVRDIGGIAVTLVGFICVPLLRLAFLLLPRTGRIASADAIRGVERKGVRMLPV